MPFYPSTFPGSPVGQLINRLSKGKYMQWKDQKEDFVVPANWLPGAATPSTTTSCSSKRSSISDVSTVVSDPTTAATPFPAEELFQTDLEKQASPSTVDEPAAAASKARKDVIIVDWYSDTDPENPRNWALPKRALVTVLISSYTFAAYAGSSIIAPAFPGIMEEFHVSQRQAALGMTLFVAALGIGPVFLSAISEIPSIGKNKVYFPTLVAFVLSSMGAALAPNWSTLMAMRFFSGFFASPSMSLGGSTLSDMWSPDVIPYFIATWAIGAVCGPSLAPIMAGFAAEFSSWRWAMRIVLIMGGAALIFLSFLLPETSHGTLLLQRARRLRKLTGNEKLRSQSELDQAAIEPRQLIKDTILKPFRLAMEPALLFLNILLGFTYAIFYWHFESTAIVFGKYGFSLGESSLPFIAVLLGALLVLPPYFAYIRFVAQARFKRTGKIIPEERLEVALFAIGLMPISLLIYGWSANRTHWIVPMIGLLLFVPSLFLLFQSILSYQPLSYPTAVASIMAANTLFRSVIASVFPLFGVDYFEKVGVDVGSTIIAAITVFCIIPLFFLKRYGHILRAKSHYATDIQ